MVYTYLISLGFFPFAFTELLSLISFIIPLSFTKLCVFYFDMLLLLLLFACLFVFMSDPVNGMWSIWGDWGVCSESVYCNKGSNTRTRSCDNPAPQEGGHECPGTSTESIECPKTNCVGERFTISFETNIWVPHRQVYEVELPLKTLQKSKSPSTHPHELTTLLFIPPGHSIFTDALQNLHKPSYFLHLSSLHHYSLLNCFLSYDSRSHKHTVNAFTKPYEHTTKVRSTTLSSYRHLIYAQPATNYTMCIW